MRFFAAKCVPCEIESGHGGHDRREEWSEIKLQIIYVMRFKYYLNYYTYFYLALPKVQTPTYIYIYAPSSIPAPLALSGTLLSPGQTCWIFCACVETGGGLC